MRTACARPRKSEEAVTPVIATILMVAITVVLAAVLYAMIGIFFQVDPNVHYVTAVVENGDKNWTIRVVGIEGGSLPTSDVRILVQEADATIGLKSTPVSDMESGTYYSGVRFISAGTDGFLSVGDSFTLDRSLYGDQTHVSLTNYDQTKTLWEKTI